MNQSILNQSEGMIHIDYVYLYPFSLSSCLFENVIILLTWISKNLNQLQDKLRFFCRNLTKQRPTQLKLEKLDLSFFYPLFCDANIRFQLKNCCFLEIEFIFFHFSTSKHFFFFNGPSYQNYIPSIFHIQTMIIGVLNIVDIEEKNVKFGAP